MVIVYVLQKEKNTVLTVSKIIQVPFDFDFWSVCSEQCISRDFNCKNVNGWQTIKQMTVLQYKKMLKCTVALFIIEFCS